MRIICCVKHVPDTNAQIQLAANKKDIAREAISYVMSPYDEFAVEEALRIREKNPGTTVAVITLGPERVDQVLRTGLAMGADEAIHILDPDSSITDPLIVARCLAQVIKSGGYDIVFCGRQAVDNDAFQVGSAIATMLNVAGMTLAGKVEVDANAKKVKVERIVEGGTRQIISGSFPVLITAQKGLNEPRFASLPGIMKAKSKPVTKKNAAELGVDLNTKMIIELLEVPVYQRKKRVIQAGEDGKSAVKQLIELLRTEAKVLE
ncbi:MAG: electron transfer flavoprotein subunit beta/FixA family protein [Candidatus Omnitrophica bacterium]|nr:electron transfer flavoprotein subunit beta/FixA family protein [Candidatus Omnitrophota bacterium]